MPHPSVTVRVTVTRAPAPGCSHLPSFLGEVAKHPFWAGKSDAQDVNFPTFQNHSGVVFAPNQSPFSGIPSWSSNRSPFLVSLLLSPHSGLSAKADGVCETFSDPHPQLARVSFALTLSMTADPKVNPLLPRPPRGVQSHLRFPAPRRGAGHRSAPRFQTSGHRAGGFAPASTCHSDTERLQHEDGRP